MAWDGKVAGEGRSVKHCGECTKMETGVIGSTNDLTIPSIEILKFESRHCGPPSNCRSPVRMLISTLYIWQLTFERKGDIARNGRYSLSSSASSLNVVNKINM